MLGPADGAVEDAEGAAPVGMGVTTGVASPAPEGLADDTAGPQADASRVTPSRRQASADG